MCVILLIQPGFLRMFFLVMERKPVYAVTLNNSLSTHPLIKQFSVYLPEPCSAAVASTGFFFFFLLLP